MSKKTQKIKLLSSSFQEWDDVLFSYSKDNDFYENDIEKSENEHIESTTKLHALLSNILVSCAEVSGVRDSFSSPEFQFISSGQGVSLQSEKAKIKFTLGIYHNEFFMDTDIDYPWYIKSMDDNFWLNFIELQSLGNFKFQENAIPSSPEAQKILKQTISNKSNIFNLIRNYILLEDSGGSVDIGSLEISWPLNISWEILLHNAMGSFQKLYRINYLLYRRYYINNRNRK